MLSHWYHIMKHTILHSILHLFITHSSHSQTCLPTNTIPIHRNMAAVVPKAATYTLGFSISQRNGKFYGSPHQQTHMRLTIRLPSKDFAERLQTHFRGVKDTDNRDVFSEETVTSHKRDFSIILPSPVHQIETNDRGVILVFDTEQEARTWEPYSRI